MLHIKQIIEDRYKSNSYVLFNTVNCIIIDINLNTIEFIKEKKLNPVYLFLTHEHFDHIKGTSQLKNMFPNLIIVEKGLKKYMQISLLMIKMNLFLKKI